MTSIGRIFIVVNLLLAGLAVGWASTHLGVAKNWKAETQAQLDKGAEDLAAKQDELDAANAALSEERTRKSAAQNELDAANAALTEVRESLAREQQKNNDLTSDIDTIKSTISTFQDSTERLVAQKDAAEESLAQERDARRQAEQARDDALATQGSQADELRVRQETIDGLRSDLNGANGQIAALNIQLDTAIEIGKLDRAQLAGAQAPVNGAVLGVNTSVAPGIVSINKGSNDKVKVGYTFDVYDIAGGTYKGKVRVVEVQGNMCIAEIVKSIHPMSQGDSASTTI